MANDALPGGLRLIVYGDVKKFNAIAMGTIGPFGHHFVQDSRSKKVYPVQRHLIEIIDNEHNRALLTEHALGGPTTA